MFTRYVAIGDSSSEGLEDPYPDGRGYRGWTDRLAETIAAASPELRYANLAVRGKLAPQVRDEQLPAVLALEPDLVSFAAGMNDALRRGFVLERTVAAIEDIYTRVRATGAALVTYTYPDPRPVNRMAGAAWPRLVALNARIRELAAQHGVHLADLERYPFASDPRLWHADRLHGNALGHERIAGAMAAALGLPATGWDEPLPPLARPGRARGAAADAAWAYRHFGPWLGRRVRGVSSGDGVVAKRPELTPVR